VCKKMQAEDPTHSIYMYAFIPTHIYECMYGCPIVHTNTHVSVSVCMIYGVVAVVLNDLL